MNRKIWRKPEVCNATGQGSRTIDRLEAADQFPKRVKISANAVGWYSDEIQEWIDSRPRGKAPVPVEAIKARMAKSA